MRLSQFRVHTVAFEVRFDPAYLLFDTSGEVWQGVKTAYPSLKVVQAAPNKVVGILDGRYQLSVELERVVIEDFPTSWDLGSYITICGSILPNVLAHLRVPDLHVSDCVSSTGKAIRPNKSALPPSFRSA